MTNPETTADVPYRLQTRYAKLGAPLTKREATVLRGFADGLTAKDIARSLELSPRTIEIFSQRLVIKLGAKNSRHAIAIGFRKGLLT